MEITSFWEKHISAEDVKRIKSNIGGQHGRALVVDFPIKSFDKYLARILSALQCGRCGYIVGNEGGAVLAALYAAGYTGGEIFELREKEIFNPIYLIEGKKRLPDKLHIRKHDADHKGHRFRDALDKIIRQHVGGDARHPVTFAELRNSGKTVPLYITAMDKDAIVTFSAETHPDISVAEAVLASCAVQPYIGYVEIQGRHYVSCSEKVSLPLQQAQAVFQKHVHGVFNGMLIAFGSIESERRAKAVIPVGCRGVTLL